jgi:hypothetical protein
MWEIAEHELAQVRTLVLRPTPSNLRELVTRLEALATYIGRMQAAVVQGTSDSRAEANLRRIQEDMSHTRRMLASAAFFFNGLTALRTADTTGYERTGLLCNTANSGRTLAQL